MMTNPLLGVRRLFYRPNNRSYWRTEELVCPCCGNLTRVEWEQERFNKPPLVETHCENPACAAYKRTLDRDSFFDQFGVQPLRDKPPAATHTDE